jgi:SSS family solute:Na+ symporter
MHLGWIDIIVLVIYLASAIVIGIAVSGKAKSLEAYLLGDRDLPWWAILGSIVATETSTATVLSVPGEAYGTSGMKFLQLAFGYVIGRALIVRFLLPLYFRGELFTAYQVLDQRFGGLVRRAASLLFLVTRNLGDGLRLFLAAIVLQKLANWNLSASVLVMGLVTIIYTFFGGMRSVVWNDCIQFVIYMVGAIAAVFVIASHISGGWPELWQFAEAHNKLQVFDLSFSISNPYTIWAGVIGGAVLTIGTHGADHMMVQRYLSARSEREAGRALFLSGIVVLLQFVVFLFIGVELACYYSQHSEVKLAKADEVFAEFIIHVFPANTGLVGLMLAAILAAAMSTLASSLNSSASALVNDFYLPWRKSPPAQDHVFSLTRWLTVVFGFIQIGVGIAAGLLFVDPSNTVVKNVLAIAGFSFGLLLGIFLLGVATRRAGQAAALFGGAVGLLTLLIVKFVLPRLPIYDEHGISIAFPWLAVIGSTTTLLAGVVFSLLQRPAMKADHEMNS